MKKHLSTILFILFLVVGLSLLLYPTVSDYWNFMHQSRVIDDYTDQVADLDNGIYQSLLADARSYNAELPYKDNRYQMSEQEQAVYQSMLNISGDSMMGYIEIPSIGVSLPIYHGTSESTLQVAVGHLEGTSLPVGGETTHCVLSGHRGLPSAKLFTDLDQLAEGDMFILKVLDETLLYEIDQILTVEPDDTTALNIEEGKDYCTLMTCTPYGINTHRLLVRGHRVENQEETVYTAADEKPDWRMLLIIVTIVILLLVLVIIVVMKVRRERRKKRRRKRRKKQCENA